MTTPPRAALFSFEKGVVVAILLNGNHALLVPQAPTPSFGSEVWVLIGYVFYVHESSCVNGTGR